MYAYSLTSVSFSYFRLDTKTIPTYPLSLKTRWEEAEQKRIEQGKAHGIENCRIVKLVGFDSNRQHWTMCHWYLLVPLARLFPFSRIALLDSLALAAAHKYLLFGQRNTGIQGKSVRTSIRPSVRPSPLPASQPL